MAPTIIAWGELVWDLMPDGPRLGGSAANVAYHAARLGNRAALVSRVGDDEPGRAALMALAGAGVDVSLVGVDDDAPTGSVRVDLSRGEPRYQLATQAAWGRIEHTSAIADVLQTAAVLCYGALAQRTPLFGAALTRALTDAPPSCLRLCDLNVRPPRASRDTIAAALAHADAVKLNFAEAALLGAACGVGDAVRFLIEERGVRLVALTRGAAGSSLTTAAESVEQAAVPIRAGGDPLGAGDAFTAALAHHLARRSPFARAVAAANAYAGHVASARGAMPEVPAELLAACR